MQTSGKFGKNKKILFFKYMPSRPSYAVVSERNSTVTEDMTTRLFFF
jgi:hypothetical protein